MEFNDLIRQRYSVRAYRPEPVSDGDLHAVLEAANFAPTACNRQPFRFVVVHTQGRKEELGRIYHREWFTQAPLVIAACGIPSETWIRRDGKNYNDVDVAIAMDHLVLAATNVGLGTCWVAAFDPRAAREILHLPVSVEPIAFTPLGYPADTPKPKERKTLEELVYYEHWR